MSKKHLTLSVHCILEKWKGEEIENEIVDSGDQLRQQKDSERRLKQEKLKRRGQCVLLCNMAKAFYIQNVINKSPVSIQM